MHEALNLAIHGTALHADVWRGGDEVQVLLLHGLGGNSITWHGVAPIVARELRAQVWAIDLPGFGASRPGSHAVSIRRLSELVLKVLRQQSPNGARWVLAGNSLGGLLALEAACRAPEVVAAVTLASLALPLRWGRSWLELGPLAQYAPLAAPWYGRRLVSRYVLDRGVPGVVDDPVEMLFRDPKRLQSELRDRLIRVSEYRLTWAHEAARAYEQATRSIGLELLLPGRATRWIRETRCPVHSIYGSEDPIYPATAWRRLERLRPDWQHLVMDDIGHVPQLEAPEAFARHMIEWLRSLRAD